MKAIAESLVPFVPSGSDFQLALRFFEEIGFRKIWGDENLATLRFGKARFMLQNISVPEWQKNQMLSIEVDDLEGNWEELAVLDLPTKFSGVKLKEPTDYPWGREINIVDTAGVCWHIRQCQGSD